MVISLEQHFFTSSKPEFATVGMTPGISESEKILLEQNSLYFLPGELLYNESHTDFPEKFVYYRCNDKYVIGMAVYTGLDSLGRPGNYFFHNILLSDEDFYHYRFNPVSIIYYLLDHNLFHHSLPENTGMMSLKTDIPLKRPVPVLDRKNLIVMVKALLSYSYHQYPVLLRGGGEELLSFLYTLFSLIPYGSRKFLFFDSYTFGVSNSFPLLALPSGAIYHQSRNTCLEADLASGTITHIMKNITGFARTGDAVSTAAVNLLFGGNPESLEGVFELEQTFQKNEQEFIKELTRAGLEEKSVFFEVFREQILASIKEKKNLDLFRSFTGCLTLSDKDAIFVHRSFREKLISEGDPGQINLFVDWIIYQDKKEYLLLLIEQPVLSEIFFNKKREKDLVRSFFKTCRKQILSYIREHSSIRVFNYFFDYYSDDDLFFFFKLKTFREQLIKTDNVQLKNRLIKWIFEKKKKPLFEMLISDNSLFKVFTDDMQNRLNRHGKPDSSLMRMLRIFTLLKHHYNAGRESAFYDLLLKRPPLIFSTQWFVKRLCGRIKKLPASGDKKVSLIREFFISVRNLTIKDRLISGDLYILPAAQRELMFDFLSALFIRKVSLPGLPERMSVFLNHQSEKKPFIDFINQRIRLLRDHAMKKKVSYRNYYLIWDYVYLKIRLFGRKSCLKRLDAVHEIIKSMGETGE